jgi:hypothetical protein
MADPANIEINDVNHDRELLRRDRRLVRLAQDLHHMLFAEPTLLHDSGFPEGVFSGFSWSEKTPKQITGTPYRRQSVVAEAARRRRFR